MASTDARVDSALPGPQGRSGPGTASPDSRRRLRLLIAAGGTGGHIFPAVAVAEELMRRGSASAADFQFLGTARGLEARLIEGAGFPYSALTAAGLKGIRGWRRVRNAAVLPRTFLQAFRALRAFRPDAVVGMGGYVAGPVVLEAAILRVPTLLVEPNASAGFTNRALAPFVTLAAIGFEETARTFGAKARVTGLPVRRAFFSVPPREHRPPFTVLVCGGSQGSAALNRCLVECLPMLGSRRLTFIHQTGERDADAVREAYRVAHVPAEVFKFIDDMPGMFARTDLVISRAGASTAGEIAAAGKAAILVPFPGATDQHQRDNARALERAGAARVIEQAGLTAQRLLSEIDGLIASPERLAVMERSARGLARADAAALIADLVERLAAGRRRAAIRTEDGTRAG